MSCVLERIPLPDMKSWDLTPEERAYADTFGHLIQTWTHRQDGKVLICNVHPSEATLEEAHVRWFGIRNWWVMSVGVQGSLKARQADQRMLGRPRRPGERTPAPLPDWYDLTHLVYEHPALGFDKNRDVIQVLPSIHETYVNYAESLHVRQPR
jgi:hypothetical protein